MEIRVVSLVGYLLLADIRVRFDKSSFAHVRFTPESGLC